MLRYMHACIGMTKKNNNKSCLILLSSELHLSSLFDRALIVHSMCETRLRAVAPPCTVVGAKMSRQHDEVGMVSKEAWIRRVGIPR